MIYRLACMIRINIRFLHNNSQSKNKYSHKEGELVLHYWGNLLDVWLMQFSKLDFLELNKKIIFIKLFGNNLNHMRNQDHMLFSRQSKGMIFKELLNFFKMILILCIRLTIRVDHLWFTQFKIIIAKL